MEGDGHEGCIAYITQRSKQATLMPKLQMRIAVISVVSLMCPVVKLGATGVFSWVRFCCVGCPPL